MNAKLLTFGLALAALALTLVPGAAAEDEDKSLVECVQGIATVPTMTCNPIGLGDNNALADEAADCVVFGALSDEEDFRDYCLS